MSCWLLLILIASASGLEEPPPAASFEAAFQGHCLAANPCTQLCLPLHDGTYECGCREGYQLAPDGYSCEGVEEERHPASTSSPLIPTDAGPEATTLPSPFTSAAFTPPSFTTLPTLSQAYISDTIELEFRPTAASGLLLVTGERADLVGDHLALLLVSGHVELRFDCGSGPALIRSEARFRLREWNKLVVVRRRWDGWMDLNGERVEGRSEGLFSRITFRQPVYIGGLGPAPANTTPPAIASLPGYSGCLRGLRINGRGYLFGPGGDSLEAEGIEPCPEASCPLDCRHGGQCAPGEPPSCSCPIGFAGPLCEDSLETPLFNGSSHLAYSPLQAAATWLELDMVLKPEANDGIILYSGSPGESVGDFMALVMDGGWLEFGLDLGSGAAVVRSPSKLRLSSWHRVRVSRTSRLIHLRVDQQSDTVTTPGPFTQLTLSGELYLGGVPDGGLVSEKIRVRSGFVGCVQKLSINGRPLQIIASALAGLNLDSCPHQCNQQQPCRGDGRCLQRMEEYECECGMGWRGRDCGEVMEVGEVIGFGGGSWARMEGSGEGSTSPTTNITLSFKSTHTGGLLLHAGRPNPSPNSDSLSVYIRNGRLHVGVSLGAGGVTVSSGGRVDDGRWHAVRIERLEQLVSLQLDGDPPVWGTVPGKLRLIDLDGGVFVGGLPPHHQHAYGDGLIGCVRGVEMEGVRLRPVDGRSLEYCE